MGGKKIQISGRPTAKPLSPAADEWVDSRGAEPESERPAPEKEKARRRHISIYVPDDLHRAIKLSCAERGTTMLEDVNEVLRKHYLKE